MASPPKIKKLDETVINRIAAGEVIQRPANALKEMLENSLDAGATELSVTVKQGGLKLMLITDNGCGIRKDDLEILCERFTTSKLSKFEDLLNINTYGFRGEALSSISHVAHLTIVTKTADSPVGFQAIYEDGKLKGKPKPCAALQGTKIRVEDLFYNVATRRKALNNPAEEHAKILDVVSKYAIHNYSVGFSLKKEGENKCDIKTPVNSNVIDNIGLIYGNKVAKELVEITGNDAVLKFSLSGQITNVNFSDKKLRFLLFINHRLVGSAALKKVIEQIYSTYLPKGSHPFVYLNITLNPNNVDVNVHPTKHEVHFLHEEAVIEKVRSIIENKLMGSNSSRSMYAQAKLPTSFTVTMRQSLAEETGEKNVYDHNKVRVDGNEQKIDKFFREINVSASETPAADAQEKRNIKLSSVLRMRANVENNADKGLMSFFKNFIFVGVVNLKQCLLQNDTKLYLCSTQAIAAELFYQIILYNFANLGVITFSSPLLISDLILLYLNSEESGWTETDGPKEELVRNMISVLQEKSVMLEDYFSIDIRDGHLYSLPMLLDKYVPDMSYLPDFLTRLCTEVDWNIEEPCFEGISREIAKIYSNIAVKNGEDNANNVEDSQWKLTVEHIVLPAVKSTLIPPKSFATDGTILEIASLPDLYKVFERC